MVSILSYMTIYNLLMKWGIQEVKRNLCKCRTNERGSTTKDGICSPGERKEKERKTTYEMARLHRERHEKGGVGGCGLEDGGPG